MIKLHFMLFEHQRCGHIIAVHHISFAGQMKSFQSVQVGYRNFISDFCVRDVLHIATFLKMTLFGHKFFFVNVTTVSNVLRKKA